jgi:ParB family transcriptional regulator, chromosome partitioning protein
MNTKKVKGLGLGLTALLGPDVSTSTPENALTSLRLRQLRAGKYQPRTRMDEQALQELAASIRMHGVMQPIVVRTLSEPAGEVTHEIIAGERRFRAAKIAGLTEVPIILREVEDKDALALALIENIQREDLNPLEEAQAIKRLLEEFAFTHEQAADAIGRSRSTTTNLLRLLQLAPQVQTMLNAGDLDMGHARALLALAPAEQIMAGTEIHAKRLSVREAEKLVARFQQNATNSKPAKPVREQSRDTARLQEAIADALGMTVTLKTKGKGGEMSIAFPHHEALQDLLERLGLSELLGQ